MGRSFAMERLEMSSLHRSARNRIRFALLFLILAGSLVYPVNAYVRAYRLDALVFGGKARVWYPDKVNAGLEWKDFICNYHLNPLGRYFFTKMGEARMKNNPDKEEIMRILTWTSMWQIYGGWFENDIGGGVDFGRCEETKPFIRKFLQDLDEEAAREKRIPRFHWSEDKNGNIYLTFIRIISS